MEINILTLGCSKNLVDSEKLAYQLKRNGYSLSHNAEFFTDVVIINTCGFILDAKTESIESILRYSEAKKQGFISQLFVMGCLSERYKTSLKAEIPEVDAFFGVDEWPKIINTLHGRYYSDQLHNRVTQDPSHYNYLKISEGCNRSCAFCAIPSIRGKQVSLPIEELVKEAEELSGQGTKELILIAQELTSYGTDIYNRRALPELLESLAGKGLFEWIRLHYAYPDAYPVKEIIELMRKYPEICKYLDIPVQHADNRILKKMRRSHTSEDIERIIEQFRSAFPEIAIRSSLITGFPGETEAEHEHVLEFIEKIRFDRLGVFTYSHEEGTPAYSMHDSVSDEIKDRRKEELLNVQERISLEKNIERIGQKVKVLIDYREGEFFCGRTEFDSPEIDNQVLIPAENQGIKPGEFYYVKIFDALEFDVYGNLVE